jgi:hypothetical protein
MGLFPEAAWQRCTRALVPQRLQPCALDQGARDRGDAQLIHHRMEIGDYYRAG